MLGGQSSAIQSRITQPVDETDLLAIRGNVHPLARPEFDRGPAPDNLPMNRMMLVLQRSSAQEAALRQLLDDQQTKSSPNYHKWLTPDEFGQEFGPTDSDVQAVTDWLLRQGFQIDRVAAGRTVIEFSGTAGQVKQLLHTEIHRYKINGESHWANSSDPMIPAALAPVVAGVASLNNFPRKPMIHRLGTFERPTKGGAVRPLFTFMDSKNNTFYAVGPNDFATIYNILPLWTANIDGTGQTIAIVADSNINVQDVNEFRSMFGLPTPANLNIILNGPDPGINGDEGEADLDTEWSGAVAKGATVDLVVSEGTEASAGVDLSALYIVDNNLAPVMSESFGTCEGSLGSSGNAFYSSLWEQAAAQGITVMISSGDTGSAGCDDPNTEAAATGGLAVSGLASTPFNVAVGGTDFNDVGVEPTYWNTTNASSTQTSAKSYIPETTWNYTCADTGSLTNCGNVPSDDAANPGIDLSAGSGGPSTCSSQVGNFCGGYAKPSWQTGAGVPADGVRDIPDISLFASDGFNGSFYILCEMDANTGTGSSTSSCDLNSPFLDFQGAGGTSGSSPAFAGIMAMVNQKTGQRQGNANYVLYKLAAQSGLSCTSNAAAVTNPACVFYDVNNTTGLGKQSNISVACQGGTPNCSNTSTASGQFGVLVNPNSTSSPAWNTGPGYDMATGLGSVNATNLVNDWSSVSFSPSTTTLTLSPTTLTHGAAATVNITVAHGTGGSGTPTGDVSLIAHTSSPTASTYTSTTSVAAYTLTAGAVSNTTNMLPGGTYQVTAHYAGDGNFGSSDSAATTVTVNPESSKTATGLITFDNSGNITGTGVTSVTYGSNYIMRVDVTNSAGQPCSTTVPAVPCPTGTITVTDNGNPLNDFDGGDSATLNSQGYAEDQPIQLPAGSHSMVTNYSGDTSFQASTSTVAMTVSQATTTTTVTVTPSGSATMLTATVNTQSNSAVPPSGTVLFLNNGTGIGTPVNCVGTPASAAGFASCQATTTATLTTSANVTAQYSGDTNYSGSVSTSVTIDFGLSATPNSITIASPGQSGTAAISVSAASGFNGAVTFTCGIPTGMLEAGCSVSPTSVAPGASTTLTVTTTGPHTVGALFNKPDWMIFGGGAILVCLLLLAWPDRKRRARLAFGLLALTLLAASLVACGGGSNNNQTTDPGTPAGTYTVTVTGTSGSLSHTQNIPVTVQ